MSQNSIIEAAASVFARLNAERIDPAYAMASDIPLELSGEAVRARLCVFTDHRGGEKVMRPDLTLPVAGQEVERRLNGDADAKNYTYAARAFRLPASKDDLLEFTQVGFECFGGESTPGADAEAFVLVQDAVAACAVETIGSATGDLRLFPSVVDALGLSSLMSDLLKRAFRQDGGVKNLINKAPAAPDAEILAALESDDVPSAVTRVLSQRGIDLIGTRSLDEIIEGLQAKATAAATGGVPKAAADALLSLQSIDCPLEDAPSALQALITEHGLSGLDGIIGAIAERIDLMKQDVAGEVAKSRFRSGYGRRFTYYDGFVFETFGQNLSSNQPVAAGGRYDGLVSDLSGGKISASAIGGVVRPDRVARACGEASS